MSSLELLPSGAIGAALFLASLWLVQLRTRDAGISDFGWAAVYTPLLVLGFILGLSGIPATERRALVTRGDDYRRYQRSTSAFIPWPPR